MRQHEYTPSWRSSGSTSLDPSSQGMIVRSARRPGCHRQKWPSARPPLACSAQPRRILSERNGGANTKPTCHHQETAVRHAQRSIKHHRQTTESRTIGATPTERDIPLPVAGRRHSPTRAGSCRAQWESWGPAPSGSLQEGCMKGMFGSWPKRLRRSDRGR